MKRWFTMNAYLILTILVVCTHAVPRIDVNKKSSGSGQGALEQKDDLQTDASSYRYNSHPYSDWIGDYQTGYQGYGVSANGFIDDRYKNYGYDNAGYSGFNVGYSGYNSITGHRSKFYGSGNVGNGGYGGYGGNWGLNSYLGYNNPNYLDDYNHLGYGYYKRPGYGGNIYSTGITPNLVTGYRGYSRR